MGMEYIYAALLLHEAKKEINEENIKKVLSSVGIEVNEGLVKALLASLEGVDIERLKEEAIAVPAVVQQVSQPVEAKKEGEKKEEKKEERKEEQAVEGLAALFGF